MFCIIIEMFFMIGVVMMNNISIDGNMLFYIILILVIIISGFLLLFISMSFKRGLKKYWGDIELLKHEQFMFFLSKTAAYRRILYFFTFLSYGLRILGVLTTFFIIYSLVDKSKFSNALLVFAALCDGINLLFPFQKFVDLFSECCIKMEASILKNDSKLLDVNQNEKENIFQDIHEDLSKAYMECENLVHTQNKI